MITGPKGILKDPMCSLLTSGTLCSMGVVEWGHLPVMIQFSRVGMCLLLVTSPRGWRRSPAQTAKVCFSVVPWPHSVVSLPLEAAACLEAGGETQPRAFLLVEEVSDKGDPCFFLEVKPGAGVDT